jgi:hypothetical protein
MQGTIGRSLPVLFRDNSIHLERLKGFVICFSSLAELDFIISISRTVTKAVANRALTEEESASFQRKFNEIDALNHLSGMVVVVAALGFRT